MNCNNCGAFVDPAASVCPNCGAATGVQPQPAPSSAGGFAAPAAKMNKFGRSYAAIASALLVFPALICLVLDYIGRVKPGMDWSFYVLGVILLFWMACVLPAMRPKRPALTACVCAGVLALYLVFLAYVSGKNAVFMQYFLPIGIMIIVSSVVLMLLIAYKVIKGEHILSAIFGELGLLSVGFEILFDVRKRGVIELRWSLIMLAVAVSAIAVTEAFSYAGRLNRKG